MQEIALSLCHFNFFCPVTGKQILGCEEGIGISPALEFLFVDEVAEFEHVTERAKKSFDELGVSQYDDDPDEIIRKWCNHWSEDAVVCFSITTSGIACGPTASTVRVGINMDYELEEQ